MESRRTLKYQTAMGRGRKFGPYKIGRKFGNGCVPSAKLGGGVENLRGNLIKYRKMSNRKLYAPDNKYREK